MEDFSDLNCSSGASFQSLQSFEGKKSYSDLSSLSPQMSPQLPRRRLEDKKKKDLRDLISNVVLGDKARRKYSQKDTEASSNPSRKSSEILFDNFYEKLQKLGQGGNSCVYKCRKIGDDSQHYAVKITKSDQEEIIRSETDISNRLLKINHPNVCKVYDFIVEKFQNTTYLVMELVSGKTLQEWISSKKHFEENEARFIMNGLLEGIDYLHSQGFVHRDITTSNVIYCDEIKKVKIIDLSTCKENKYQPHRKLLSLTGNDIFRAPEMFVSTYSQEVDIWSAGIVLYYLLFGSHPFYEEGDDMVEFVTKLTKNNIDWEQLETTYFGRVSSSEISLCSEMLCKDPRERVSSRIAMSHPFLKQRLCSKDFSFESKHKSHLIKNIMRMQSCEELFAINDNQETSNKSTAEKILSFEESSQTNTTSSRHF